MDDFEEKLNKILSSPDDMAKILKMARSFSDSAELESGKTGESGSESSKATSDDLGFDPKTLQLISRLMNAYSSAGKGKTELISTMKPYLKEERRDELDRALKIAKIAKAARAALAEFSGGDFHL